ncbi:hypothetical protein HID58_007962, partial [Brassica napus]
QVAKDTGQELEPWEQAQVEGTTANSNSMRKVVVGGAWEECFHRSGSGSSSSSEDDGQVGGGRRREITDKIKEKLPGHHDQSSGQSQGMGMELPLVL